MAARQVRKQAGELDGWETGRKTGPCREYLSEGHLFACVT